MVAGERVGNTDIWLLPSIEGAVRIRMPIPPSTNRRQTIGYMKTESGRGLVGMRFRTPVIPILTLTKEARDYLEATFYALRSLRALKKIETVSDFCQFRMWWFTPRATYDNHNGLKLLCDALQYGGIVSDDRFIMPWVKGVENLPADPHVEIEFDF